MTVVLRCGDGARSLPPPRCDPTELALWVCSDEARGGPAPSSELASSVARGGPPADAWCCARTYMPACRENSIMHQVATSIAYSWVATGFFCENLSVVDGPFPNCALPGPTPAPQCRLSYHPRRRPDFVCFCILGRITKHFMFPRPVSGGAPAYSW